MTPKKREVVAAQVRNAKAILDLIPESADLDWITYAMAHIREELIGIANVIDSEEFDDGFLEDLRSQLDQVKPQRDRSLRTSIDIITTLVNENGPTQ